MGICFWPEEALQDLSYGMEVWNVEWEYFYHSGFGFILKPAPMDSSTWFLGGGGGGGCWGGSGRGHLCVKGVQS